MKRRHKAIDLITQKLNDLSKFEINEESHTANQIVKNRICTHMDDLREIKDILTEKKE